MLGAEHAFDPLEAGVEHRAEVGIVEVDGRAIERAQDRVGDVGRTRVGEEMPPARLLGGHVTGCLGRLRGRGLQSSRLRALATRNLRAGGAGGPRKAANGVWQVCTLLKSARGGLPALKSLASGGPAGRQSALRNVRLTRARPSKGCSPSASGRMP